MRVPAFLLRRLYVRGSLQNTDDGWGFTLRNSIAGGEANALDPLTVDGAVIPADSCFFHLEDRAVPFSSVDAAHRFGLESGRDIRLTVIGDQLAEGEHTVQMGFTVVGFGRLVFDFTDVVL